MSVVSSLVNATPDTNVLINLSGTGPDGRIAVNTLRTLAQLGVSTDSPSVQKPQYPTAKVAEINSNPNLSGDEKMAAIQKLVTEFQQTTAAHKTVHNVSIEDEIARKVLDLLVAEFNFTTGDQAGKARISESELQVVFIPSNNLFSVTGTATWGFVN